MAVFRVVLAVAVLAAPFAAAQATTTSSTSSIMSAINTLVGASFDPSAVQAQQTMLGSTVAGLQSGFSAVPAASSSSAGAAGGTTSTSAAASGASPAGLQGLFSALGSQATSVIKPAPVLPVGLAETVQAWSVPHVDVGSFVLNPTAFDLSDLYAALHPQNFSYCTPAVYTPAALNPAVVIAPSTSVTIETGSCQVNDDDTVTCFPPKMSYSQVPFTYTSPFYTAATWTDTQCIIAKNLTESSTEVLYSGGADVTFPTVDAWLSTFDAPATDLSLKLGPAGFVPINHALAAKPVLTAPPPPPAIAASASATPAGTNATVGGTNASSAGRRLLKAL